MIRPEPFFFIAGTSSRARKNGTGRQGRARIGPAGTAMGDNFPYQFSTFFVPGNSQDRVPYRCPRPGVHRAAAGHTDPHSALGISARQDIGSVLSFDLDLAASVLNRDQASPSIISDHWAFRTLSSSLKLGLS